ncbi:ammonia-dependent NAD(+) synthetase [Paraferrimonas sedimenticola]|uniref:NH(3)-dependent NAD(+) synthetase n=1 Tax=Paraferrimonas sedimenticola TaxID=375674 RepID=A0AA37RSD9_9GAMM|nr:ammonia-dependent NAD(+) synthetase [Paraferrimonas sedimenticola]GLP95085.1 NH(3)-dependent NAD(+) synthetase [Paraferrimonas sedimenticola]
MSDTQALAAEIAAIQAEMQVKPEIDPAAEVQHRVDFIKTQLLNSGLDCLVLGISGGVDSSTCGRLCQIAVDQLNASIDEKRYRFIAVRLPYSVQADEDDAQRALAFIQPDVTLTINVQAGADGIHQSVMSACADAGLESVAESHADFCKGNTKARMRMAAQFQVAGLYRGLVPGTDHSAENIMGFYTKFGDGACDLAPLFGLSKRQVRALADHLGACAETVGKVPTADLEDNQPQLADEQALGVTYDQIDNFLEGREVEADAQQVILATYRRTAHKREPIPVPSA